MAEDTQVPPLPRRAPDDDRQVPGGKPGWGSGLTQPLALSESLRQRIRAALDYGEDDAPPPEPDPLPEPAAPPGADALSGSDALPHADALPGSGVLPRVGASQESEASPGGEASLGAGASPGAGASLGGEVQGQAGVPAGRRAALPRRVPGANNAPEPPARITRPAMRPSLVHLWPTGVVTAVPAVTLGATAAAAGSPPPTVSAEPRLVPAQRPPAEQPGGHDRRDGAGNGARPPAPPATPLTRMAMWEYLGQAEARTEPLPAIPAARPGEATEETSRGELPARQGNGQAGLGRAQLPGATGPVREPGESPPWAPVDPPMTAPPKFTPPKSVSPQPVSPQPVSPQAVPPQPASPQPGPPPPASPESLSPQPVSPRPVSPQAVPPQPVSPRPGPPPPAPPESVSPQPVSQAAPPQAVPPQPDSPEAPALWPVPVWVPERPRRGRGFMVGVAIALVLALAGSLAFLLNRPGGTAPPASAPTASASASAAPSSAAQVRAAAAAWVASQVSRARPAACDPVMCQALRAQGVPAADLLVLRPGRGDPLRAGVIVVTPAVTTAVGTKLLTADAPAALASFGSGSSQVSVRVIFPQGAAAYRAALRRDIADRRANESTLLENPRVTALPSARRQLQGGQVDSRLLLTLAQFASQWPLSIAAFGDRAAGASPGVPLRSADLAVTGDVTGQARQMAAFARQLQGYFAAARIRVVRLANGQAVVQVAFAAPSPLGVLNG